MRKLVIALSIAASVTILLPQIASAGTAMFNKDMQGSKMALDKQCMPPAVMVGVVYSDRGGTDAMDAASAICYSKQRGEFEIPNSDFGDRAKVRAKCNRDTEYVWGIAYKDRVDSDEADGVTVICRNKKSGSQRIVNVPDLAGGRAWMQFTGANAIGISCNDRQDSDSVDGCTVIVK
ncbi:MAG: hypothetical protein HN337_04940 [Deltaproteobacteria bacterium]|jgi:hypothetical protein|nr:hypothetical protein [Deltaproteobacteria bacterium]